MRRLVRFLAFVVRRAPVGVALVAIALTVVLGALAPQQEMATGNEGFSPDNPELTALEIVGERFSSGSDAVMQVVVSGSGTDVIGADGLATVNAVQQAVLATDAASALSERMPIASFLAPVQAALAGGPGQQPGTEGAPPTLPTTPPAPPTDLDDAQVDELFTQGLEALPPEQSGLVGNLLAEDASVEEARADAGLLLIFLDTSAFAGDDSAAEFDALIAAQEEIAAAVRDAEVPAGFSAEPFAFELLFGDQDSFTDEVGRLFGAAFLIILVILAFVYFVRPVGRMSWVGSLRRSGADMLLTLLTIVMSIVWMQGFGVLLGPEYLGLLGVASPPTQILPILLIGLGVDYAIHLTSRYREEVGSGRAVADAATRASGTVGVALVLATMTTVVGFLTNITNPLPALKDFGILAGVGILSAFVLMLTFLPSVRVLLDRRAERGDRLPSQALGTTSERVLPRLMAGTSVLARRFAVPTLVVTVLLGGLGAYGLTQLSTEFSFTDFVPQDSPVLATFETIQEEFGGGFGESTNVLVTGDVATPEAHNALVRSLGNLADTEGVVRFGDLPAAMSPVSVIGGLVADGATPGAEVTPDPAFAELASANGLEPDLTVADDGDVAAIYIGALEAAPEQAGGVLDEGEDGFAALVQIQTQAGEAGAAQLRRDLTEDFAPLEDAGTEVVPTSNNIVSAVIVKELQDSQIVSLIITLAAAMALLIVTFWVEARRPMLGFLTIAPVILVVLWVFGMMAATGIPFDPITAVLSALAIGIGVPYTIHITHRFQEDRRRFDDPAEAIRSTVRHTGGALAGSALTTVAGFGILVTSSLVPFRRMGQVTAYAIAFSFLAAVVVLPSMLILWDRWHRRRGDAVLEGTGHEDLVLELTGPDETSVST